MRNQEKLTKLLETNDMSKASAENYSKKAHEGNFENLSSLDVLICRNFIDADEMDDFERDIDYTINMLQRIKKAI